MRRITPRASFIGQNNASLTLNMKKEWPLKNSKIPKHPDDIQMGFRNWPSPKKTEIIVLEKEDINEEIRLKEFANVPLND